MVIQTTGHRKCQIQHSTMPFDTQEDFSQQLTFATVKKSMRFALIWSCDKPTPVRKVDFPSTCAFSHAYGSSHRTSSSSLANWPTAKPRWSLTLPPGYTNQQRQWLTPLLNNGIRVSWNVTKILRTTYNEAPFGQLIDKPKNRLQQRTTSHLRSDHQSVELDEKSLTNGNCIYQCNSTLHRGTSVCHS